MQKYYEIAALLFYKLKMQFGNSALISRIRVIWRKVTEVIQGQGDSKQFIIQYFENHKKDLEDIENIKLSIDKVEIYYTFLAALNRYFESDEVIEEAQNGPLNEKYSEIVQIYPTFPGLMRDNMANDEISVLFQNMMFFIKNNASEAKNRVINYYFDDSFQALQIGFVPYPITDEDPFDITGNCASGHQKTFMSETDEKYVKNFMNAILDNERNFNIVFGPELVGSECMDKNLRAICNQNGYNIVICPSYHKTEADGKTLNRAKIYIYTANHRLNSMVYYKKYKAEMRGGETGQVLCENIVEPDEYNIPVFHIRNIGKVGFFICKDYLMSENRSLIDSLNLDIVLLQCYTEKISDFLGHMRENIAKKHFIILGNACQAIKNEATRIPLQYTVYNYKHGRLEENNLIKGVECGNKNCNANNCQKKLIYKIVDNRVSLMTE